MFVRQINRWYLAAVRELLAFRPYSFASPPFDGFAMSTLRWQLAALRELLAFRPCSFASPPFDGFAGSIDEQVHFSTLIYHNHHKKAR